MAWFSRFSAERPRRHRTLWWVLGSLVVLLIVGRLVAPSIVAKVVRNSLADMKEGYRGDIRDVELSVLSAEVAMLNMRIAKTNGRVPVPFMDIDRFVLGVVWEGFRPRTELVAIGAHVNLVDAESKAAQQWGPPFDLRDLRKQLPFELSAVRFIDSQLHFRNYEARPQVDLYLHQFDAAWEHLSGCLPMGWAACESELSGQGLVMRGGSLSLRGGFDRHDGTTFHTTINVKNLKPVQFNSVLLEYAKIDAREGTVEGEVHYRTHNAAKRLVIVPRLYGVKVAGREHEGVAIWREMLAGMGAGYFERRRGTKAIEYASGGGKGKWSVIDWSDKRTARAR